MATFAALFLHMANTELILPKMGESVAEATITTWLKKEGDRVEAEEAVVEIATDKVDSEVPSTASGVLLKILVAEGAVAKVGQAIAIIGAENGAAAIVAPAVSLASESASKPAAPETTAAAEVMKSVEKAVETVQPVVASSGNRFYSPLVKSIAREEGVGQAELDALSGTGQGGRVTKHDLLGYVQNRKQTPSTQVAPATTPTTAASEPSTRSAPAAPSSSLSGDVEIIQMDRMRKLIADHMVKSKHTAPHVTSFVEADVTRIVNWRLKVKDRFEKRDGEKLTFTPIFIEAIVKAIKDFPMINVSVDGDTIVRKKGINIGMATALPSGNLIVPVIKNADQLNLLGLVRAVNDLANRARNNKLLPDEIQGGTYTITNVGSFGNVMGTPIINQPQVAIMAVGAIKKKPAVIETPDGDFIGIRQFMFLSHSYDHRVVDGALGGMFVRRVADYLENWDANREF